MDEQGSIDEALAVTARDFIRSCCASEPDYIALWRHLKAARGVFPAECGNADYTPFTEQIATLIDEQSSSREIAQAVLGMADKNVAVPPRALWQADRIRLMFEMVPDTLHGKVEAQVTAKEIMWLPMDAVGLALRRLLRDRAFGLNANDLDAFLEREASPGLLQQMKGFFGRGEKVRILRDLGMLDERGAWSELGFQRQQAVIAELRMTGRHPSLELLRWELHHRHRPDATVPFIWALLDDNLPPGVLHRARRLASVALSGGMLGDKVTVGGTITPAQLRHLQTIAGWIYEPLNARRFHALEWLGELAAERYLDWERWTQICSFVADKRGQTPERELIRDWLDGLVTFEGEGRYRQRSAEPFVGVKIGRNDPCSCGSGNKHKKCCGR